MFSDEDMYAILEMVTCGNKQLTDILRNAYAQEADEEGLPMLSAINDNTIIFDGGYKIKCDQNIADILFVLAYSDLDDIQELFDRLFGE